MTVSPEALLSSASRQTQDYPPLKQAQRLDHLVSSLCVVGLEKLSFLILSPLRSSVLKASFLKSIKLRSGFWSKAGNSSHHKANRSEAAVWEVFALWSIAYCLELSFQSWVRTWSSEEINPSSELLVCSSKSRSSTFSREKKKLILLELRKKP